MPEIQTKNEIEPKVSLREPVSGGQQLWGSSDRQHVAVKVEAE